MVMQVHDELVFEVPEAEVDWVQGRDPEADGRRGAAVGAADRRGGRRAELGRGALRCAHPVRRDDRGSRAGSVPSGSVLGAALVAARRCGSRGGWCGIPASSPRRAAHRGAACWRWSSAAASRAWSRACARAVDGEREFDRGGKALFMGFVMVAATLRGVAAGVAGDAGDAARRWRARRAPRPGVVDAPRAGDARRRLPLPARGGQRVGATAARCRVRWTSASTRPCGRRRPRAARSRCGCCGSALGAELVGVAPADAARERR